MRHLSKKILQHLLIITISLFCLAAAFLLTINLWNQTTVEFNENVEIETQRISDVFETKLNYVFHDAIILINQEKLNPLIDDAQSSEKSLSFLKYQWTNLFETVPSLYQIRFIDAQGFEIFKQVKQQNIVRWIPSQNLQNKKHRYYFALAMYEPEKAHISLLDLNIENKQIEIPYRPTIRASAAYYKNNQVAGVVVLNFDLTNTFTQLKQLQSTTAHWLVNSNGYFLISPNENAWGWLTGQEEEKLDKYFPEFSYLTNTDLPEAAVDTQSKYALQTISVSVPNKITDQILLDEDNYKLIVEKPERLYAIRDNSRRTMLITLTVVCIIILASAFTLFRLVDQLNVEKENALKAEKLKTKFIANMSHEIRTPMNGIYGFLQLSRNETDVDVIHHHIEHSLLSYGLLKSIIDDILDFAKIESGQFHVTFKQFDLMTILENIAQIMKSVGSEKHLDLWIDVSPDVPKTLIGDPLRITQMLSNLISNAFKFTHEGEILITVRCLDQTEHHGNFVFAVKDTGIGLTEEQQALIFERFIQADENISFDYGGTGLGLSICKELASLMNGSIEVESEFEKGSTFFLKLPLAKVNEEEQEYFDIENEDSISVVLCSSNLQELQIVSNQCRMLGWQLFCKSSLQDCINANINFNQFQVLLLSNPKPSAHKTKTLETIKIKYSTLLIGCLYSINSNSHAAEIASRADFNLEYPFVASELHRKVFDLLPSKSSNNKQDDNLHINKILTEKTIWVVEDNLVNQELMREIISKIGANFKIIDNGEECLHQLATCFTLPDLILMDLHMPIMDGLTTTKYIRETENWAQIPIVAVTANVTPEDIEDCASVGMQGFLAKPLEEDELLSMCEVLFDSQEKEDFIHF
ncbi:ATP-binding protein [Glaciecola sp. 1036]|uniref:ATP-binding protein n=1 Tax=Alteromonadaceae TaxID=72275 RepID=UPI003D06BCFA